ncbi:MAG: MFS transporter [Geminicoccaceae bacterium]
MNIALGPGLRDGLLLGAGACTVMAGAAIAPGLASMQQALGTGEGDAWISRFALVLPALVIAITAPFAGSLADRLGRRSVLALALAMLALSGVAGAASTGYGWLLISRAVLGLASALVLSAATALIADIYEGPARQRMFARQAAANTFGGGIILLVSGALAALSWRLPFALYLVAGPLAWLAWRLPPRGTTATMRNLKPPAGLLPILLAMAIFYLVPLHAAFLLQSMAAGPAIAGAVIAGATIAGGLSAMSAPKLQQAIGYGPSLAAAALASCLGLIGFAFAWEPVSASLAAVLIGLGFGVVPPLATHRVMATIAPVDRGAAAGWISSALLAGQFLSMAVGEAASALAGAKAPFLAGALLVLSLLAGFAWRAGWNARWPVRWKGFGRLSGRRSSV